MINLLNQPWTERLGWTLLHFLWQGILAAALYALARALAGGRISARGRYAIACVSLLAMTAAPAVTYWWLGDSGQAAQIGDSTAWGARQLVPGVAYSSVTDPWQQAMPWIVMAWFAGAAACFFLAAHGMHLRGGSAAFASCAGAHRMATNPRPADGTHARVAKRAVAGHGSSGFACGHRLASPSDSRPGGRTVWAPTRAGRGAVGARTGACPAARLPGERFARDRREPALLPSCGVVDLKPDPGRARALLRRSRRCGERRCAGVRTRTGGIGIHAAGTLQGCAIWRTTARSSRRVRRTDQPHGGAQARRDGERPGRWAPCCYWESQELR